jgi:hypothetical protein
MKTNPTNKEMKVETTCQRDTLKPGMKHYPSNIG